MSEVVTSDCLRIAIVGAGISGSTLLHTLKRLLLAIDVDVSLELFDQGRGAGGRTSTRFATIDSFTTGCKFDHGCQFFRADTPIVQPIVQDWVEKGWVKKWEGRHIAGPSETGDIIHPSEEFFGLPSQPSVYVSSKGGLHNIARDLIEDSLQGGGLRTTTIHFGVRVEEMQYNEETKKWKFYGKGGRAALHDTPEEEAKQAQKYNLHEGRHDGFDVVVVTDISSCFENWHRASAGVPEDFSTRVRQRAGSRVPLFTAMISFKNSLDLNCSSITFSSRDSKVVWFAAQMNSKVLKSQKRYSHPIFFLLFILIFCLDFRFCCLGSLDAKIFRVSAGQL